MTADNAPPFGGLVPTPRQEMFRRVGLGLPRSYLGRRLASLLLGPAGGRARRARDVIVFGAQKARLHPFDNICEKRVYLTPQHWDYAERAHLARRIAAHQDDAFYFADIGANVGLYSLFARARTQRANKRLNAVCVEPDPEMRARAAFNIAASGAEDEIRLLPYAATGADGPVAFAVNMKSRGMSRIDAAGGVPVEGRTLTSLLTEAAFPRVDAMKVDIEGCEFAALDAFFRAGPPALWPGLIILEVSHDDPARPTARLVAEHGYRALLDNRHNMIFERVDAAR